MLGLKPTKDATKFLDDLPPKQFRQVWLKVLSLLSNPLPHDSEQLSGYPYRRVDVGEYRIVYKAHPNEIELLLIGKRNDADVYQRLKQKLRHS